MTSRYIAEYENSIDSLPGKSLSWLNELRTEAFKQFSDKGFPSLREEEWRYTNVSAIEKKLFKPQLSTNEISIVDKAWLDSYRVEGAISLVVINGHFNPLLSNLENIATAVLITNMADALKQQPELVQKYLNQSVSNDEHSFIAFNTAWFTDGLFVHIPANTVLDRPIQLIHVVTDAECLATSRNIIALDTMAEAKVIETFVGVDDAYLSASVTEISIAENAELNLIKVQTEGNKAFHFGGTYVKQKRDSRFKHHNFAFGSLLARNDIHTDLDVASECDLNGLYLGVKRQHIDNHTRINHLQPHAISRQLYKGILDQRARGVFQGRVYVAEDAQKTDSEMNNRNLLLSNDAEVDTKPQLEIYADDVKCAHGVTIGQLDEKSIFYMQSRCVDEETARNMLTFAFANEMVAKVKIAGLREMLGEQLLKYFPQEGMDKDWL